MESHSPVAILNELLALEERSLPVRLLESTVFVSNLSVDDSAIVCRMADAQREHCAWLSEAIIDNGGAPGPRTGDARSGDLHFQDIRCLMPRLAADRETIIAKCALAAEHLSKFPEAAGLISRIQTRHRNELAILTETAQ